MSIKMVVLLSQCKWKLGKFTKQLANENLQIRIASKWNIFPRKLLNSIFSFKNQNNFLFLLLKSQAFKIQIKARQENVPDNLTMTLGFFAPSLKNITMSA